MLMISMQYLSPAWIILRISMGMSFTQADISKRTGTNLRFATETHSQGLSAYESTLPRATNSSPLGDGKISTMLQSSSGDVEMVCVHSHPRRAETPTDPFISLSLSSKGRFERNSSKISFDLETEIVANCSNAISGINYER
jgi:hypothetical protein